MCPGTMPEQPFRYRNADGSLNLDAALGEEHVRHYTKILDATPAQFAAMQLASVVTSPAPDGEVYSWREPPPGIGVVEGYILQPRGRGPDACSSRVTIALLPEIIWDVCGYYRRLGFHWTEFSRVQRREVWRRYQALDPHQEREDLHYAAAQLYDPVIRWAYDLQPLGGLFLGDKDVRAMLERMAARRAAQINAQAHADGTYQDEPITQGDVLSQWGFEKAGVTAQQARERLREAYAGESAPLPGEALGSSLSGWDRQWSYYRLVEPDGPPWASQNQEAALLEAWQGLVCAALSEAGVMVRFSVGIWPGHGPKVWRDSNIGCIFFIESKEATQGAAAEAVRGFLAQQGNRTGNQEENDSANSDAGRSSSRADL